MRKISTGNYNKNKVFIIVVNVSDIIIIYFSCGIKNKTYSLIRVLII